MSFEVVAAGLTASCAVGVLWHTVRRTRTLEAEIAVLRETLEGNRVASAADALSDPLTGLPTREAFETRLTTAASLARRESRALAVLHVDIDGFKTVNETLGYRVGDEALLILAERLKSSVRGQDMVSRLGGDEFVILVEMIEHREAVAVLAARVLDLVSQPIMVVGRQIQLSASVGISVYPDDGDVGRLLAQADAATQAAKLAGKARFHFYSHELDASSQDLLTLQSDLRAALERGEFELHYQPKLRASDSALCGAEALLRWRHPTRGPVSPTVFIPVAERFGLILPIGLWVLDRAVAQAAAWLDQGFHVPIAVNLSLVQLRQADLVESVAQALARYRLPPTMLVLEITESAAMEDAERTLDVLRRLAGVGIRISIDDFGTGYSSLSYLRRFTAHELKVDRSFVTDVTASDEARSIVIAVVQMAHALGLRVVAEGVETEQQRLDLTRIGCDAIQGFLFDRPLPALDFANSYRYRRSAGNDPVERAILVGEQIAS